MTHTIVAAAERVANDKILIGTYEACENGDQEWIFSKNKLLKGAVPKPISFPAEKKFNVWWQELKPSAKQVLYTYANFWFRSFENISKSDFKDIKSAYDKWPSGYCAIYYGTQIWACNLFVGESLYAYGRNVLKNGKYYSAQEIWEGQSPFKKINKDKVVEGSIAGFNYGNGVYHVEIVTSVNNKKGSFCSRGAGRASQDGVERCGESERKINNKIIQFLTI